MSAADQDHTHPAHGAAWELLPWYEGEGLTEAQRALVRSHLRECLVCRREARRLRQLAAAMAAPAHDHASAQAFQRLSARIQSRETGWRARLRELFAGLAAPVPALAMVGVAVVAVLVAVSQRPVLESAVPAPNRFQTLGRAERLESTLEAPLLRVVLREGVVRELREDWLARHQAELVEGPSPIGVMTVRLALGARHLDSVIAGMRAEADTLFVEPLSLAGRRPERLR